MKRAHKLHVGEDGDLHSEGSFGSFWDDQRGWVQN